MNPRLQQLSDRLEKVENDLNPPEKIEFRIVFVSGDGTIASVNRLTDKGLEPIKEEPEP